MRPKSEQIQIQLTREIEQRKYYENALKKSEALYYDLVQKAKLTEERYHSLPNSTPDAIVIYDIKGHTTYVNNAFTNMFGWVLEDLKNGVPYVPEEEMAITIKNVKAVIDEGIPITDFETERFTKNRKRVNVSISASRFNDHEGSPAGMLVILRDITERKYSDKILRKAKEEAEEANKAKSAFLANMSHELRTPLNAIIGFSKLMTRDKSLTKAHLKDLETIIRSGEHLLTLINDVLELSKIEAGRILLSEDDFNFSDFLASLMQMFHLRVQQKGLYLKLTEADDLPQSIRADQNKLRQVLINLLGNAAKFTPKGGITLSVTRKAPDNLEKTDKYRLKFEVIDTGIGISKQEQEKIFETFFQIDGCRSVHQGTGLGLNISQKYVDLMGGTLKVTSEVGKGTNFSFDIPVGTASHTEVQSRHPSRKVIGLMPDQKKFRILVAEDNKNNRELLVRLLKSVGFDVKEATDGQDAVAIWEQWRPHLVWMDMRMPIMDGYAATTQIRAQKGGDQTIIIALTASAFEENRRRVIEHGGNDFVRKPFRNSEIFAMIEKYLNVHYLYEDDTASLSAARQNHKMSHKAILTALNELPNELTQRLMEATELSEAAMIDQVIEEIGSHHQVLGETLSELAINFKYDEILTLIQMSGRESTQNL